MHTANRVAVRHTRWRLCGCCRVNKGVVSRVQPKVPSCLPHSCAWKLKAAFVRRVDHCKWFLAASVCWLPYVYVLQCSLLTRSSIWRYAALAGALLFEQGNRAILVLCHNRKWTSSHRYAWTGATKAIKIKYGRSPRIFVGTACEGWYRSNMVPYGTCRWRACSMWNMHQNPRTAGIKATAQGTSGVQTTQRVCLCILQSSLHTCSPSSHHANNPAHEAVLTISSSCQPQTSSSSLQRQTSSSCVKQALQRKPTSEVATMQMALTTATLPCSKQRSSRMVKQLVWKLVQVCIVQVPCTCW